MGLEVKLEIFEGPLDLLLHLIKENKIDIYNIPIAQITDQYLTYLGMMKQLDLVIAGEFLVMAAMLLYIKSKMLLPLEEGTEEEEGADPRAELVRKLLEYQSFKEAAKELGVMEGERSKIFTRQLTDYYLGQKDFQSTGDSFSASLYDLICAFGRVIKEIKPFESFHEVFEEVVSIEERMEQMKIMFSAKPQIRFTELFGPKFTRNELIITFLALLELIRLRLIRAVQGENFSDILIEWKGVTAANG